MDEANPSMIRVLTDADLEELIDLSDLLDVIEAGIIAQHRGIVERPERPHLPLGIDIESTDPLGTGLVMPAYVHGAAYFVTKLVGVFEGNRARGLATIHGVIVLIDAETGRAVGLLDGTRITNARTGCVGGVAARALTDGPVRLGLLGAGQQARWQAKAIDAARDIEDVRIYAPSDSRVRCAADLAADGIAATAVDAPPAAVAGADLVVTATTSRDPVFPAAALEDDAVVIAIGAYTAEMQEIEAAVVEHAVQVFADVPEEVATIGDIADAAFDPADLLPLGALLDGEIDPADDGVVLVESVGSAVFDAVASEHLFDRAEGTDRGVGLPFH